MRATFLLILLLISGGSLIADTNQPPSYLRPKVFVFETPPEFNPQAKADVYLTQKDGKLYVQITHMVISHNPLYPDKKTSIKNISLNIAYLNKEEFCYVSSGKKFCKPPGWKYMPNDARADIKKILEEGKSLEIDDDMTLEFDLAAHNIQVYDKLNVSLSLNVNEKSSLTLVNTTPSY